MKIVWLTLCLVMVLGSACTTDTFPILIPSSEEPTDWLIPTDFLIEEDPRMKHCALYDGGYFKDVTVISPNLMKADEWLYSWAKEAVTRDSVETHSEWIGEWLEKARWMYANGFVASERRCAEGRDELAGLIENYAAILRQMRSNDISNYRMAVAHTLWQTLPEGDADCSAYLSELHIEDFMPVVVNGVVSYGFG